MRKFLLLVAVCIIFSSTLWTEVQFPLVGVFLPFVGDGIWLDGHTSSSVNHNIGDSALAIQFGKRRALLATHLHVFKKRGVITSETD